ncbi:MAG: ATPase, partial [Oscillospiraceae bacterium]|nr:ATPase [Oscillospiraceae bacterium]
MAIEKLTLVNVEGPLKKVNKTLVRCCESGYFHMSPAPDVSGTYLEAKSLRDKGQYERMIKRCRSIAQQLKITLDENASYDSIEYNVSIDFKRYLDEIEKKISELQAEKNSVEKSLKEHGAIYNNLHQLEDLDVDFAELFACEYIKIRFGHMPEKNIRKLDYYKERPYFFYRFKTENNSAWCMYIVPKNQRDEADYLFNALGFQRVMLPAYLSGTSEAATERLIGTIRTESEKLESIESDIAELGAQEKEKLSQVYAKLVVLDNSYELRSNVLIFGSRFHFSGYIPERKKEQFESYLNRKGDIEVTPVPTEGTDTPVKLKNNWFVKPFEMFVKMYGLPAADGMDPTPIVAITYMLVYGIMFGDVGQGLCITLLGLLMTKFTKVKLAPIMTRIGISSALFGVLYGSVFGNEHIITPFFHIPEIYTLLGYETPPENIFGISAVLLIAALLVGVSLVVLSMIVNMIICIRTRDIENGLFGASGLTGFVFYVALLLGVGGSFIGL